MTALLSIVGLILGGTALGALLIKLFADSQRQAGKLEERNEETQRTTEAKREADAIVAEHRDPDGVSERLRRGDF